MYLSFRWYDDSDPITLKHIRQIPEMANIVTVLYDVPVGKLWPMDRLVALKQEVESA